MYRNRKSVMNGNFSMGKELQSDSPSKVTSINANLAAAVRPSFTYEILRSTHFFSNVNISLCEEYMLLLQSHLSVDKSLEQANLS